MGMVQEFKEFAVKGNAMDMAVGIIVGASFNKVVTSLVNDVIMPPIGLLLGGVDFPELMIPLRAARLDEAGQEVAAVAIRYGVFANAVIDFLIVAFTVFAMVKFMNRLIRRRAPRPA